MRGDRRSPARQRLSRQNATDARSRTIHRTLPTGNRGALSCAQVRRQLAAYRRDDWATGDLAALTAHLSSCLDCRRLEATYRQAGEHLRQLPSITPPADFRDRVFAAIRADQQRLDPSLARVSLAVTNPALPVVRPGAKIVRRQVRFQPKGALALAAALGLALLGAGILPHLGVSSFSSAAASLGHLSTPSKPSVARYPVDPRYGAPASAMATTAWLVYSAADASHGGVLFAEDRKTKRAIPLLTQSASAPITVRGVTNTWAVWSVGTGASGAAWSLLASRLPTSGGAQAPITLMHSGTSPDALTTLGGVWVNGNTALVAGATANGTGLMVRYDLSQGTPSATVIARGAELGHIFTDPSSDHGAYYWADVWYDSARGLHGSIWRGDGSGQSSALSSDDTSFHPTASAGTLSWVEVDPDALANLTPGAQVASPDAEEQMLNQLAGALYARNLASGQQWQVSSRADVTSVQDNGAVVIWRSDSQTHAYDLQSRSASAVQSQVGNAAMVTANDTTVVWTQPGSSALYVLDTSK